MLASSRMKMVANIFTDVFVVLYILSRHVAFIGKVPKICMDIGKVYIIIFSCRTSLDFESLEVV